MFQFKAGGGFQYAALAQKDDLPARFQGMTNDGPFLEGNLQRAGQSKFEFCDVMA